MRKKIITVLICLLLATTAVIIVEAKSVISEENLMKSDVLLNPTIVAGYTNITVQQAYSFLTNTSNGIQIPIDVRTPSEWAIAHIDTPAPENPQHWPYLQMGQNLSKFIELYKGKEVILYCKAGARSFIATKLLIANNFTGTIYNMIGGIDAWIAAGYPTKPNSPPNTPVITGEKKGKIGQEYQYIFNTTDPEQDDVYYYVNWSDNTSNQLIGPYYSGEEAALNHIWSEKGTYTVKVKARDIYGAESDYATLEIKMPYSYNPTLQFLELLFQRFPHTFPILRQLLGY
jgi:rhodanese-related sulfurtransferase